MGEKYEYLKKVLDDSHYTVALCGSGILAETGCRTFQNQDYAYEIEQKYGRSPEDIFASLQGRSSRKGLEAFRILLCTEKTGRCRKDPVYFKR